MKTKIRKPLAPPSRPHSQRVKPDDARCQVCHGMGTVVAPGKMKLTLIPCPHCNPDGWEGEE